MVTFERGPGWDWLVTYDVGDGPEEMTVYGVLTIEDAARECRASFGQPDDLAALVILAIERERDLL